MLKVKTLTVIIQTPALWTEIATTRTLFIKRKFPHQPARRHTSGFVTRLSNKDTKTTSAHLKMNGINTQRSSVWGFNQGLPQIGRARRLPREGTLRDKQQDCNERVPLVTYHPGLPNIGQMLRQLHPLVHYSTAFEL